MQTTTTPVDTALAASIRTPDYDKLRGVGQRLQAQFLNYERDRRLAELRWAKSARQYLGIYDPEVESQIEKNRSKAYPKLTRVKCVSMLSRLMNLLFPSNEKNWTVTNTPVPNLSEEDLNTILTALKVNADPNVPLEDKMIELAVEMDDTAMEAYLEGEEPDEEPPPPDGPTHPCGASARPPRHARKDDGNGSDDALDAEEAEDETEEPAAKAAGERAS